jgi:hypothetical protein
LASTGATAQSISAPFSSSYTILNLGNPGIDSYGSVAINPSSPDTLYFGGGGAPGIYSIDVTRGVGGNITGFSGAASLVVSNVPDTFGNLAFAPNGDLLYTDFANDAIGEIKPGSSSPDKIVSLAPEGVAEASNLALIPNGFGNNGAFEVFDFSDGTEYDLPLTPDGSGTYNIGTATPATTGVGTIAGIAYVAAGNPDFGTNSALAANYDAGTMFAYQVSGSGSLILSSQQTFMTSDNDPGGEYIDPVNGDLLFASAGEVGVVEGFQGPTTPGTPEPGTLGLLAGLGVSGATVLIRRRRLMNRL